MWADMRDMAADMRDMRDMGTWRHRDIAADLRDMAADMRTPNRPSVRVLIKA